MTRLAIQHPDIRRFLVLIGIFLIVAVPRACELTHPALAAPRLGYLGGIPLLLLAAFVMLHAFWLRRLQRRCTEVLFSTTDVCVGCLYALHPSTETCPECGLHVAAALAVVRLQQVGWRRYLDAIETAFAVSLPVLLTLSAIRAFAQPLSLAERTGEWVAFATAWLQILASVALALGLPVLPALWRNCHRTNLILAHAGLKSLAVPAADRVVAPRIEPEEV